MSDDLENNDFEDESFDEFDDGDEPSGTLGELVQSNPLVKIGIIFGAAALIFGTIILFGGEEQQTAPSAVNQAPDITTAPGTEEVSPAYTSAIIDKNQQNYEEAIATGESNIPIPINTAPGVLEIQNNEEEEEDPLQRWRRLQEERLQRELQSQQVIEPTDLGGDNGRSEAINSLAEALSAQMQSVLARQGQYTYNHMDVTDAGILQVWADKEQEQLEEQLGEDDPEDATIPEIVVIPAGEIEYAQIITEANSDVPGPVLGQIVSGPLAGSRILGSFQVQEELISLQFNTVVVDGESLPIDAIALDPATTLPGMATDVDHRYLQRIVIPTAAKFIEGVASAVAESGRTSVSVEGDTVVQEEQPLDLKEEIATGIEDAGSELSEIIDEMNEDVEPLIIIKSGTPMGLLFLQPITRPAEESDF